MDGVRNKYGDFVVTKIHIPDVVVPVAETKKDSESEESSESESEPEPATEETKEESKAPVKKLTKKEMKELEDAEFERVMAEMGIADAAKQQEAPAKKVE